MNPMQEPVQSFLPQCDAVPDMTLRLKKDAEFGFGGFQPSMGLVIHVEMLITNGRAMCSVLHLFQDGEYHLKGRPLARVFIHADTNEPAHVRRDPRRNGHSQLLQSDLHANFHWR